MKTNTEYNISYTINESRAKIAQIHELFISEHTAKVIWGVGSILRIFF